MNEIVLNASMFDELDAAIESLTLNNGYVDSDNEISLESAMEGIRNRIDTLQAKISKMITDVKAKAEEAKTKLTDKFASAKGKIKANKNIDKLMSKLLAIINVIKALPSKIMSKLKNVKTEDEARKTTDSTKTIVRGMQDKIKQIVSEPADTVEVSESDKPKLLSKLKSWVDKGVKAVIETLTEVKDCIKVIYSHAESSRTFSLPIIIAAMSCMATISMLVATIASKIIYHLLL